MNISPINSVNTSAFRGNPLLYSNIKVAGKVDGYVDSMIGTYGAAIEKYAGAYDKHVTLAQRKADGLNSLYINSGNITSRVDLNAMEKAKDFLKVILTNIKANSAAEKDGLDSAMKSMD